MEDWSNGTKNGLVFEVCSVLGYQHLGTGYSVLGTWLLGSVYAKTITSLYENYPRNAQQHAELASPSKE